MNKWKLLVPIEVNKTLVVGNIIGTISIENTKVRELVNNIDILLAICLPLEEEDRLKKWNLAVNSYSDAMVILSKKEDNYTNDKLRMFQDKMNIFWILWVELHQQRRQTNYINIAIAGHVLEYMIDWGNLYRFSQQGWESLNSLIKRFFFL